MFSKRSIIVALALALVACSDRTLTAPPVAREPLPPIATSRATVRGIVVISRDRFTASLDVDGMRFDMKGEEADALRNVRGAEVLVVGTWDAADGGLVVERFSVLAMGGREAYDGVLELHESAYAIRLARNELHWLADPPAAIAEAVGSRIWLTEAVDELPAAFGVISFTDSRRVEQLR